MVKVVKVGGGDGSALVRPKVVIHNGVVRGGVRWGRGEVRRGVV